MKRFFLLTSLLLTSATLVLAQGGIQKTRQATQQACSEDLAVVAASFSHYGEKNAAGISGKSCADAPVSLTQLVVLPDGFVIPYIKNLDPRRSVVGAAFFITTFDTDQATELESKFEGNLLHLPPGSEMRADSIKPFGPIKTAKQTTYLVQFSSIRFDDGSEWHFEVDCKLSNDLKLITCKAAKQ